MMKTRLMTSLGCLGLVLLFSGANAAEQAQPWDGPIETLATAGYENGVNSGLSPMTESEEFRCAVAWDVWHSAYAGKYMPPAIEDALPYPLKDVTTASTREAWQKAVAKNKGTSPMLALIAIIEKTSTRERYQDQVVSGLRGDKAKLFRITSFLGTCANPPM